MPEPEDPILVAALIERHDGHVLICRPPDVGERRRWEFPGGPARPGESPEAAIRRLTAEQVGLRTEILQGQPPLRSNREGREAEYRFFLCGPVTGEARPLEYAEVRWVARGQLCEYDFDPPTCDVVRWFSE